MQALTLNAETAMVPTRTWCYLRLQPSTMIMVIMSFMVVTITIVICIGPFGMMI